MLLLIFLAIVGLITLAIGIRGRRVSTAPHCRCGFDLSGTPRSAQISDEGCSPIQPRCPECGSSLSVPRQVRQGRRARRPVLIFLGIALTLLSAAGLGTLAWGAANSVNWYAQAPTWLLVSMLDLDSPTVAAATLKELDARTSDPAFRKSVWPRIERKLLARQSNLDRPWPIEAARLLERRARADDVSAATRTAFLRNCLQFQIRARSEARSGDPLPVHLIALNRAGDHGTISIVAYVADIRLGGKRIDGDRVTVEVRHGEHAGLSVPQCATLITDGWYAHSSTTNQSVTQMLPADAPPGETTLEVTLIAAAVLEPLPIRWGTSGGIGRSYNGNFWNPVEPNRSQEHIDRQIPFYTSGSRYNVPGPLGTEWRSTFYESTRHVPEDLNDLRSRLAHATLKLTTKVHIRPAADAETTYTPVSDEARIKHISSLLSANLYEDFHQPSFDLHTVTEPQFRASVSFQTRPHTLTESIAGNVYAAIGNTFTDLGIITFDFDPNSKTVTQYVALKPLPARTLTRTPDALLPITIVIVPSAEARRHLIHDQSIMDHEIWFDDVKTTLLKNNGFSANFGPSGRSPFDPPPTSK